MTKPLYILCAADERFAMPLAMTMRSAAIHCSRPVHAFALLSGHNEKSRRAILRACALADGKLTVEWLEPDPGYMKDVPTAQAHISQACFLRLSMGRRIPPEIGRVIYIDSDAMVCGDLAELWETPLDGNIVGAAPDMHTPLLQMEWALKYCFDELDVGPGHLQFNSGVMVVDLEAYRAGDIERQCVKFLERWRGKVHAGDQDSLNASLCKRWKRLDYRWNVQLAALRDYQRAAHLSEAEREALRGLKPGILHFSGPNKPWNSGLRSPWCQQYVESVGESGWHGAMGFRVWQMRRLATCVRLAIHNKLAGYRAARAGSA